MAKSRTKRRPPAHDSRLSDISHAPRERWSHGGEYDVVSVDGDVAARRVQKVVGAVDGLRRSGRISDVEVSSAARWVADYERSLRSSYCDPATAGIRGGGNSGPELRWLGGIAAATRCAQVRDALGSRGVHLLVAHVHHAMSVRARVISETGGFGGSAMGRAADEVAGVLRDLAAHYGEMDRQSHDGILRPRVVTAVGMAA